MYELHGLTGSRLVDINGNDCGPESGGAISKHRTREAAEKAAAKYRRECPLGSEVEVREASESAQ